MRQKPQDQKQTSALNIHPYKIMLNMALMGITSLFIGFTVAYMMSSSINWKWADFAFPKLFLVSTILIILSSFSIRLAIKAYKQSEEADLKKWFLCTAALSIGFVITQILGWRELTNEGIMLDGTPDGGYLYVISGIHVLHVLAGLIPLFWFLALTYRKLANPVDSLMFFTESRYQLKFEMLERYWHFIDLLWVYLLFFFLFNHL